MLMMKNERWFKVQSSIVDFKLSKPLCSQTIIKVFGQTNNSDNEIHSFKYQKNLHFYLKYSNKTVIFQVWLIKIKDLPIMLA